ncbi:MAG: PA2778 family cysteine peptidase [Pseudomonadota bacterium]
MPRHGTPINACLPTARPVPGGVLLAATFLILLMLGGCATLSPLTEQELAGLPRQHELSDTPFFPQEIHQCGPAALATLLQSNGVAATPEQLVPAVYLPAREGSLQLELIAATRRHGRIPYVLRPRMADLLQEVAAGNPVLVLQNLGLNWLPRWHYAVVVGYDLAAGQVILRSGTYPRMLTPLATFEHTWARGDRWALLALPPERLPATAEESRWLTATASFERLGDWDTALTAYHTALTAWPQSELAALGLGNSQYALGDKTQAAATFQALTQQHPRSAVAFNNLAQALLELGRLDEAERAAQQAVNLGGPLRETFAATLQAIREAIAAPAR